MQEVVIVSAVLPPIRTMGGSLRSFHQRDLAAIIIKSAKVADCASFVGNCILGRSRIW